MKVSFASLCTLFFVYTITTFVSIYSFGPKIESDILLNVSDSNGWEAYVINTLFLIIGGMHIPLIFFVGKESLLIMIHECRVAKRRESMWEQLNKELIDKRMTESSINRHPGGLGTQEKMRTIAEADPHEEDEYRYNEN